MVSNWCYNVTMGKDEEVRLTLRVPASMHKQIQRIAKEQQRSFNGQMIYILADWMSIDTDHIVLKRLIKTSTGFVTADEMVSDYEKHDE